MRLFFYRLAALLLLSLPIVAEAKTAKITISSMTCHGCTTTIKTNLEKLPGVTAVKINLEKKEATVEVADDAQLDLSTIRKTVLHCGYKAGQASWVD